MCLNYRMGRFADFIKTHQADLYMYANSGNEEVKQLLDVLRKAAKWEMKAATSRQEEAEKAKAINNGNEAITHWTTHYMNEGGARRTRGTRRTRHTRRTRGTRRTRRTRRNKRN